MEKKTYTAPEFEIDLIEGDIVLMSTVEETGDLDGSSQKWDPQW